MKRFARPGWRGAAWLTELTTSLYRRLGGYDVIAAIIDDMFAALRADPALVRFASGRALDSHMRARQLLADQMCELSGGPCSYIGPRNADRARRPGHLRSRIHATSAEATC